MDIDDTQMEPDYILTTQCSQMEDVTDCPMEMCRCDGQMSLMVQMVWDGDVTMQDGPDVVMRWPVFARCDEKWILQM